MSDGATEMLLEEKASERLTFLRLSTANIKLFIHKQASADELLTIAQLAITEARRVANERPS